MSYSQIILAGMFTVIGAVIQALIMKYGIPRIFWNKTFNGTGEAHSLEIKENKKDFQKNRTIKYRFEKAKINLSRKTAFVETRFTGIDNQGNHYSESVYDLTQKTPNRSKLISSTR